MEDSLFTRLPNRPLLRPDEVAVFFNVTARTIHNWYAEGRLGGCSPNGSIRIYRLSVIALVKNTDGKFGISGFQKNPRRKIISPGLK